MRGIHQRRGNADITAIDDHVGGTGKVATDDGTCVDANWARMLTHRIFGKNDTRAGYTCLPPDTSHKGDILVVRYAAPWEVGDVTTPDYQPAQYYLRSSLFEGRLFKGSDHDQSVNTIDAPAVRTAELVAHGYFIHASPIVPDKCPQAGNVPSLYRMTLVNNCPAAAYCYPSGTQPTLLAEEIAYGVDNFQVQYGVDTDDVTICPAGGTKDDNSVDCYVDAKAADDAMWDKVIAARVWLLTRAECPETGYTNDSTYAMGDVNYTPNDHYRRQLYTSTIRLRNR